MARLNTSLGTRQKELLESFVAKALDHASNCNLLRNRGHEGYWLARRTPTLLRWRASRSWAPFGDLTGVWNGLCPVELIHRHSASVEQSERLLGSKFAHPVPELPRVLALNTQQHLEVCRAMNPMSFQELVQGHPPIVSVMQ